MEVVLFAFGASALLAVGGAALSDGVRHRAAAAIAGAAFGVFGVAGLIGALLLVALPAYRRATLRRERAARAAPNAPARGSMARAHTPTAFGPRRNP